MTPAEKAKILALAKEAGMWNSIDGSIYCNEERLLKFAKLIQEPKFSKDLDKDGLCNPQAEETYTCYRHSFGFKDKKPLWKELSEQEKYAWRSVYMIMSYRIQKPRDGLDKNELRSILCCYDGEYWTPEVREKMVDELYEKFLHPQPDHVVDANKTIPPVVGMDVEKVAEFIYTKTKTYKEKIAFPFVRSWEKLPETKRIYFLEMVKALVAAQEMGELT